MDRTTQANAASAEQSASAAQQLSAQAMQMMTYVADLEALVGSGAPQAVPAPRQQARRSSALGASRTSTKSGPTIAAARGGRPGRTRAGAPATTGAVNRQAAERRPDTLAPAPQVVMSLDDDDFFDVAMTAPAGRSSDGR
ncbi:MAG: hypothetical protein IPG61_14840 [bacterium]|nr:hypothetical protein [bacterium]